ncbi:hypothetical protein HU200_014704 [Digitaria exilis]|uniref:Uncharacterized protein n=1 Tax=Digitaria exilis TaxID=1010633 RepID=A0A835FBA3_9POAL|nr:hypothetical protein HU200_014704 [Digitaria exilis]
MDHGPKLVGRHTIQTNTLSLPSARARPRRRATNFKSWRKRHGARRLPDRIRRLLLLRPRCAARPHPQSQVNPRKIQILPGFATPIPPSAPARRLVDRSAPRLLACAVHAELLASWVLALLHAPLLLSDLFLSERCLAARLRSEI